MRDQGQSLRRIGLLLPRSPCTITRAVRHLPEGYDATWAGHLASQLWQRPRRQRKLAEHTALFKTVTALLKQGWSPEQIASALKRMCPNNPLQQVSHETI